MALTWQNVTAGQLRAPELDGIADQIAEGGRGFTDAMRRFAGRDRLEALARAGEDLKRQQMLYQMGREAIADQRASSDRIDMLGERGATREAQGASTLLGLRARELALGNQSMDALFQSEEYRNLSPRAQAQLADTLLAQYGGGQDDYDARQHAAHQRRISEQQLAVQQASADAQAEAARKRGNYDQTRLEWETEDRKEAREQRERERRMLGHIDSPDAATRENFHHAYTTAANMLAAASGASYRDVKPEDIYKDRGYSSSELGTAKLLFEEFNAERGNRPLPNEVLTELISMGVGTGWNSRSDIRTHLRAKAESYDQALAVRAEVARLRNNVERHGQRLSRNYVEDQVLRVGNQTANRAANSVPPGIARPGSAYTLPGYGSTPPSPYEVPAPTNPRAQRPAPTGWAAGQTPLPALPSSQRPQNSALYRGAGLESLDTITRRHLEDVFNTLQRSPSDEAALRELESLLGSLEEPGR